MSKPAESETVTVTRKQFSAMSLAVLQYAGECKSYARECARIGRDAMAKDWADDADKLNALYQEIKDK